MGLTFADDMYIMKHTRKKKEKEKKMQIAKTYKITYKPFHYNNEVMTFVGKVERFTFPPRMGDDGILIKNEQGFHNLTIRKILSYEEI